MDSKWDSIDQWRKFFQTTDTDIFDVIEQAIKVAATDHPEEFRNRRDRFAEHLLIFKLRMCSGSKKEDQKSSDGSLSSSKVTGKSVTSTSDVLNPCPASFSGVASVVDDEEKLREKMEKTKRRLREVYQRTENAKKLRRIQILDFKDLPKQEKVGNLKREVIRRR